MKISFTSLVFKENDMYVAYSPELDISSCGEKIEEAKRNLVDAVGILLEECHRMGTLEDILTESGYTPVDSKHLQWSPPKLISTEKVEYSTPAGA